MIKRTREESNKIYKIYLSRSSVAMIDKANSMRHILDIRRKAGYGNIPGYHIFDCIARIGKLTNIRLQIKGIPFYLDLVSRVAILRIPWTQNLGFLIKPYFWNTFWTGSNLHNKKKHQVLLIQLLTIINVKHEDLKMPQTLIEIKWRGILLLLRKREIQN